MCFGEGMDSITVVLWKASAEGTRLVQASAPKERSSSESWRDQWVVSDDGRLTWDPAVEQLDGGP